MSSVDNRIVDMQFNNTQFEHGISTTISSLDKLKSALGLSGASKGLDNVQTSADKMHFGTLEGGITKVSGAFLAMSTVAITALSNITNQAISAGTQLVKSLTVDPIKAGLSEYETNLNSIQTILSNTSAKGSTLKDVNAALEELNTYSDKTIYNFSEMARNIGTFTAAGVDLKTSTEAIKGIANLAAVSGSNAEQASTAMYQLSQAISTGTVKLQDWNSVTNAGMGGEVFQNALKETARVHGVAVDDIIKKEGSFRESLSAGWLSSDILTETLSKFTGDLSEAQLKSMGYTDKQVEGILKMGVTAVDAATKVKTMSQLVNTLQETAGSGWAQTWQLVLGDFDEAKILFTNMNDVLGGMISASADARNKVLGDWKNLGGRTVLIEGLTNIFNGLMDVLVPIKEAFREIFPAKTGQELYDLTVKFRDFTKNLHMSDETATNLKRTFKGVFAIFSIVGEVIGGAIHVVSKLVGALFAGSGGFLSFTGGIGDLLVAIDNAISKGGLLSGFFNGLGTILALPVKLLSGLASAFGTIFSGFDTKAAATVNNSLGAISGSLSPIEVIINSVRGALKSLSAGFKPVLTQIAEGLGAIGRGFVDAFSQGNFDSMLSAINTGFFGALVLAIRKFLKGGLGSIFNGGIVGSLASTFGALTDTLSAMQQNIKAGTLLKIAGAVALLVASVIMLSTVDPGKLSTALGGIAATFTQLLIAMAILTKIGGTAGFLKIPMLAAGMIMLSTAVFILTMAVRNLADLNWEQLGKGLAGIAGILVVLIAAMVPLTAMSGGITRLSAGMVILAVGIRILVASVAALGALSLEELAKGLLGLAAALVIIIAAMYIMPPSMLLTAASLVALGVALNLISAAMSSMGGNSWSEIARGLAALAGALAIIAAAMYLMPPTMIFTAAGLVVVGLALTIIAGAMALLGGMSWGEIGKGLTALAGLLALLALGLTAMLAALPGALALVVAAASIAVLAPALLLLSSISWGGILKGLIALAAAFAIVGGAAFLLAPVTPVLIGLAAAVLIFGAGLALIAVAQLAFASAFALTISALSVGTGVIVGTIQVIVSAIPAALKAVGEGIIAFASAIAKGGPSFVAAFTTLLTSLLQAIINVAPKIREAFAALLNNALSLIVEFYPKIAKTALGLLLTFLSAISNNIYRIVTIAVDIITKFLDAIAANLGKIVNSAANLVIQFVNALANTIDDRSEELGKAAGRLGVAIIKGMLKGIAGGVGEIVNAVKNAASSALDAAKRRLGINSPSKEFALIGQYVDLGFAQGIDKYAHKVVSSAQALGDDALSTVKTTMEKLSDVAASNVEMSPVIAPVLDLTQLQADAAKINPLFAANPLAATLTYSAASRLAGEQGIERPIHFPKQADGSRTVSFEQNIYSPKTVSAIDIYRQTRNQLSLAKEALNA
jgi:tape measure domain-containing protein